MLLALLAIGFQSTATSPLTLTSYNIRYGTADDGPDRWELRKPLTFALLKKHPSDILAVQEALDFQVQELRKELGFASIGVGRDDGKTKGEFSAILYDRNRFKDLNSGTFWLSDTPEMVGSKSWGNKVVRICTWAHFEEPATKRRFYVFNTHLDHESQPSREKSVSLILDKISNLPFNEPTILAGDFNAGESNPAVRAVYEAGFWDTWRMINPESTEPGTFNGFKELGREKIDHVFADKSWKVTSAAIINEKIGGRWPSDHLPVYATLEWPVKK